MKPMFDKIPELTFKSAQVDNPTAVQMLNDRNYEDTMNVTWGPPSYSVDQVTYPWYHSKGGLNHANVNDTEMDDLLVGQRREKNPEAQKEIWKKIEARISTRCGRSSSRSACRRVAWHNYVVNFRPHGFGAYTCYANAQARAVWLDEGAPAAAITPMEWQLAEV